MRNFKFNFREIKEFLNAKSVQFNKKNEDIIYGSKLNCQLSDESIFGMD